MHDEAIALWRAMEKKQRAERDVLAALLQYAVDIDTPETIYDTLRANLDRLDGPAIPHIAHPHPIPAGRFPTMDWKESFAAPEGLAS